MIDSIEFSTIQSIKCIEGFFKLNQDFFFTFFTNIWVLQFFLAENTFNMEKLFDMFKNTQISL